MGLVEEGFGEEALFKRKGCDWATGQEISPGRGCSLREDTGRSKQEMWVGVRNDHQGHIGHNEDEKHLQSEGLEEASEKVHMQSKQHWEVLHNTSSTVTVV